MPNSPLKIDPNTSDMATIDVTLGRKYAMRRMPLRRIDELSPSAMSSASTVIGTVDITQMIRVLPIESQNVAVGEQEAEVLQSDVLHRADAVPALEREEERVEHRVEAEDERRG